MWGWESRAANTDPETSGPTRTLEPEGTKVAGGKRLHGEGAACPVFRTPGQVMFQTHKAHGVKKIRVLGQPGEELTFTNNLCEGLCT